MVTTISFQLSLEEIVRSVSHDDFSWIDRQFLANFNFVKDVEHYFGRKLLVRLKVSYAEKLLVGMEEAMVFLSWMEQR